MSIRRLFPIIVLTILLLGLPLVAQAQEPETPVENTTTEQPVVFSLLFYSPNCPYCHILMDEDLPLLQQQYGEQFEVLLINVQNRAGAEMYYAACDAFNVPQARCGAVPAMVVDNQVMIGGGEIPQRLPGLIETGLARGGIGLPDIPGLQEAYAEAFPNGRSMSAPVDDSVFSDSATFESSDNWIENFQQDPLANGIAVFVLILLTGSVGAMLYSGVQFIRGEAALNWLTTNTGWMALLGMTILSMFIALTLALEQDGFSGATMLAVAVLLIFTVALGMIWEARREANKPIKLPNWLFPALSVAGLVVASYLLYVESGEAEAVCGAVGNCNAVQASEYAELFGVLPVGGLGVIGYIGILGAWGVAQRSQKYRDYAQAALLVMLFFGAAFSIYLTFLEPFVIGATCAWCLTSAMVMLLLLWIAAPEGWRAMRDITTGPPAPSKKKRRRRTA
ncbi:MAG: vitamin K epoxide reductase family protein [Anaerolineales bacterium]